jgi:hypothetical protein
MNARTSIIAAGAAVVLGTTGALVLPAVASAHSAPTTLKFIALQKAGISFTRTTFGSQETDVSAAGKIIGFDMIYFTASSATTGTANVAVDVKGGFLNGTVTTTNGGKTFAGKVTGGTGAFKGATGTITAKALNKAGTRHAVTITYSG